MRSIKGILSPPFAYPNIKIYLFSVFQTYTKDKKLKKTQLNESMCVISMEYELGLF